MSPIERFAVIGRALYGPAWQTEFARRLGISDRTVRNWLSGSRGLPDTIWADLDRLLREQRDLIERLIRDIKKLSKQ
jgi:hypothetical protein